MNLRLPLYRLALLAALTTVSGCGIWETLWGSGTGPAPEGAPQKASAAESGSASSDDSTAKKPAAAVVPAPQAPNRTNVELIWQVPEDPVDGFVVHYGFDRTNLEHQVKVKTTDLERLDDASYGKVYRYVLKEIPSDSSVFVAIAAFRGDVTSPTGDLFEVKP